MQEEPNNYEMPIIGYTKEGEPIYFYNVTVRQVLSDGSLGPDILCDWEGEDWE